MFKLKRIEKQHLILCEGSDAEGFLTNYLHSQNVESYRAIQVADFGGNQELRKSLELLQKTDGFSPILIKPGCIHIFR